MVEIIIDIEDLLKRKVGLTGKGKEIGVLGIGETLHGVAGVSQSTTGGYGVHGVNSTGGTGVAGESTTSDGVLGRSESGVGVHGVSTAAGVLGESTKWVGVHGKSEAPEGGHGVLGEAAGTGVSGISRNWVGVYGESNAPAGSGAAALWGDGKEGAFGVKGHASGEGNPGVAGYQMTNKGAGVYGEGATGVNGVGHTWAGVYGETRAAGSAGVLGEGLESGLGVKGVAKAESMAGVAGYHVGDKPGPGVYGEGNPAGYFHGDVIVTGDLRLTGADVAEQFDVASDAVDEGTIVVLDDAGALSPCEKAYDRRVAGVVSGAGDRKPALVLDRSDDRNDRRAVAVVGKAWCRADGPIEVGDLLTTSDNPGHAMAAKDRDASFGAVLGKALTPLAAGTGLVLVLVGLG